MVEQTQPQPRAEVISAVTPEPLQEIVEPFTKEDLVQEPENYSPSGAPPNLDRQPSRTSNRVRPNINYTNLAQGTSDVSASVENREP